MRKKSFNRFVDGMSLLITYPDFVFQPIRDISTILYNSFFDYGVQVELKPVPSAFELGNIAKQGIYSHIISVNTHDFLERNEGFFLDKPKTTKLISYNLEQTPLEDQNSYWASMRLNQVAVYGLFFDYIAVESPAKRKDIDNIGLRTLHLDLPYHSSFDDDVKIDHKNKEYDVFFVGAHNDRRLHLMNKIIEAGLTLAPVNTTEAFGREYKAKMIAKSKVCLNVHFSGMEYFEKPRIFYDFIMNKGVILTEKIAFPEHFTHLKDFYMSIYNNIIPTLMFLTNKYEEDDRIIKSASSAYDIFKSNYNYTKVIDTFLHELHFKEMMFK